METKNKLIEILKRIRPMDKIDHIALRVDNIAESVAYYLSEFKCMIIYQDDTWAFLQFDNIKLALVIEDEHPYHIAFETDDKGVLNGTLHRDGSISKYIKDPSGNTIELIKYPIETKHFADGFHEGRWEDDMAVSYTHLTLPTSG